MTASRIGLIALTLVALALAIVVVAGGEKTPTAVEAARPFADVAVEQVRWERAGTAAVEIVRRGEAWTMTAPAEGPVDAAVVDDVIESLRAARVQRRDRAARVPTGQERVAIVFGDRRLRIGPEVGGGAWIADGDAAYLIESWVVNALDRSAIDLRIAAPLAAAARATGVEIHVAGVDLVASGRPLATSTAAGRVELAHDVAGDLVAALGGLRVVAIGAAPVGDRGSLRVIGNPSAEIAIRGECAGHPDATAISGAAGDACVATDALDRALAIARRIANDPIAVAELRPVTTGTITAIELPGGYRVEWNGAAAAVVRGDGAHAFAADDDRAAALRALFTSPATVAARRGFEKPVAAIGVTTTTGRIDFGVTADRGLMRDGYATVHRVAGDLAPSLHDLRSRTTWHSDAALIEEIAIADGASPPRTLRPADGDRFAALAGALAAPRVERWIADSTTPARRTITIRIAPPPVADAVAETHAIEVLAGKCVARIDRGGTAILDPVLCSVVAAR